MAKTKKIIAIICMVMLILSIGVSSFAEPLKPSEIRPPEGEINGQNEIKGIGGQLVGIFQTVGVVVAVVILLVLGIKYMMGSAEEKADYKKSMIPYIVGAILIFAASTVTNVVYELAMGLQNAETDG